MENSLKETTNIIKSVFKKVMLRKSCEYVLILNKKLTTALKLDNLLGLQSEYILKDLIFNKPFELADKNIGYIVVCSLFYVLQNNGIEDYKFADIIKLSFFKQIYDGQTGPL